MGALRYKPELDGLRAFAVLFVVFVHAGFPWTPGGARGVDVFFVLSGYLITRLLLDRQDSYGGFMARRLRRLAPALVAMVVLTLPALVALRPVFAWAFARDAAFTLTYTINIPRAMHAASGPYFHAWSLAVEMQFYLLWPLVVPCCGAPVIRPDGCSAHGLS